jgi:mono/diheme cytochrome c family protein
MPTIMATALIVAERIAPRILKRCRPPSSTRKNAMRRHACGLVLLLAWSLVAGAPAFAGETGPEVVQGQRIAERWCSNCHVVSPSQTRAPADAVPSFAAIARMPSTTQMSLKAFLASPHPPMPDLKLSRGEIDDLSKYILSLRAAP